LEKEVKELVDLFMMENEKKSKGDLLGNKTKRMKTL